MFGAQEWDEESESSSFERIIFCNFISNLMEVSLTSFYFFLIVFGCFKANRPQIETITK